MLRRRLREKNSNNTKKFIEERKSAALKQSKERERLKKIHEKQLHDLQREIDNVSVGDRHAGPCHPRCTAAIGPPGTIRTTQS